MSPRIASMLRCHAMRIFVASVICCAVLAKTAVGIASPVSYPISNIVIQPGTRTVTVKWETPLPTKGWLRFGPNPDQLQEVYDVRGAGVQDIQHKAQVTGLAPLTWYIFYIVVDGEQYDNLGSPWKVSTWGAVWLPMLVR